MTFFLAEASYGIIKLLKSGQRKNAPVKLEKTIPGFRMGVGKMGKNNIID